MAKEKEEKKVKGNGMAAKLRGIDERLIKVEKVMKGLFSTDEDEQVGSFDEGRARLGLICSMAILCVAVSLVFSVPQNKGTLWNITGNPGGLPGRGTNDLVQVDTNGNLEIDGDMTIGGDITGGGDLSLSGQLTETADNAGTGVVSTATVVESQAGFIQKTVITLVDLPITVVFNGPTTNHTGGTKVYVFPEGRIQVLGVIVDSFQVATNTTGIEVGEGGDYAMGTVIATLDTLASTEVDLCPSTSIDTITNVVSAALAAEVQFDGTSTAKDVFVNLLIDTGDLTASTTAIVSRATITMHWLNLGDY